MASQPSPPADPLQFQTSDDCIRQPIIITISSSSSLSTLPTTTTAISTTVTTSTPTTASAVVPDESSKNCKLYELIANSDEESELKKLCDEEIDVAVCGTSTVNSKIPDTVQETSVSTSSSCGSVLQNSILRNRGGRKKHDEDRYETKSDSHFHPYANPSSPQPVIHRSVVKSCTDLRSTAPVLYDLLSDDCDVENRDRINSVSRTVLPEPNLNVSLENNNLLRPLSVQMPFVSSPGLPTLPAINQFPASYISTLLQQNLLQTYSSVNMLKTTQAANYLEDLPSVTPILPSVLRDVLAFDDDTKKVSSDFFFFFCTFSCSYFPFFSGYIISFGLYYCFISVNWNSYDYF